MCLAAAWHLSSRGVATISSRSAARTPPPQVVATEGPTSVQPAPWARPLPLEQPLCPTRRRGDPPPPLRCRRGPVCARHQSARAGGDPGGAVAHETALVRALG